MGSAFRTESSHTGASWLRWDDELRTAGAAVAPSEEMLCLAMETPSGDMIDVELARWHPERADYLRAQRFLELFQHEQAPASPAEHTSARAAEAMEANPGPDGSATKAAPTKTLAARADESADPVLTPYETNVLRSMDRFDTLELLTIQRIKDEIGTDKGASDKLVRQTVNKLIELGWAERPEGDRHGARLTLAGRKIAKRLAE
jgi:hypothetical protein